MTCLIDQLRDIEIPPSHQPTSSELLAVAGALIAYVEHGDELLAAAERDVQARGAGETASHVSDLLSPPPEPAEPAPAAPAAAPDDRDAEIASLRQQLATAQAQATRTQVTGTPLPTAHPSSEVP